MSLRYSLEKTLHAPYKSITKTTEKEKARDSNPRPADCKPGSLPLSCCVCYARTLENTQFEVHFCLVNSATSPYFTFSLVKPSLTLRSGHSGPKGSLGRSRPGCCRWGSGMVFDSSVAPAPPLMAALVTFVCPQPNGHMAPGGYGGLSGCPGGLLWQA